MALIKCPECGKEISDKAEKCPNCGYPISNQSKAKDEYDNLYSAARAFSKPKNSNKSEEKKEISSTGRMVVGIIFIVLSVFTLFQSCAAGISNVLGDGTGFDGTLGAFSAILMLIIGIVSIVTRKTSNSIVPLIMGIILVVYGYSIAYVYNGTFKDLKIYGMLMMICSLVYFFGFKKLRKNRG